jgi:hypothetical protein
MLRRRLRGGGAAVLIKSSDDPHRERRRQNPTPSHPIPQKGVPEVILNYGNQVGNVTDGREAGCSLADDGSEGIEASTRLIDKCLDDRWIGD